MNPTVQQTTDDANPLTSFRLSNSFAFSKKIVKSYGTLDKILDWCRQELADEWRWEIVEQSGDIRPGQYVFYFDSDRDACAFSLSWS